MSDLPVIGLHGAPRSGTTWIGQIFNSAPEVAFRFQPFFAHAFRPRVDAATSAADLDQILKDIAATDDDFILQRGGKVADKDLAFAKSAPSHLVYKEARYHHLLPTLMEIPRFQGVGIIRDPLEALSSWRAAPREFDPAWDFGAEWREAGLKNSGRIEEFFGYAGWKRAALIFQDMAARHPDRFRILRYGDLTADPVGVVSALFGFLGVGMSEQTATFLGRSTSRDDGDTYGVFRDLSRRAAPDLPDAVRQAVLEDVARCDLATYLA
ncbi:MAG: sulfotransferase [Phenylobacterium sp.]|uniref:sulfotransferase family protein n=1 Tax=Phenylobacterium sp. TaxID=1871053 RepID=UPI001B68313E|nr:sulfotransferase [Phenylobacterium sp.]MBP7648610.1 sulfotransferase [Phenylobacterium sp.]MBP7817864.1 sulfotransferase [Phenylobacterium sp.]MBP9231485.1 sulfotransferase [Phenylobacterium sp.]MBP9755259.1 sulfotransferase [Phenylobacterium sp.]